MQPEPPPRGSPLLHPIGDKAPATYWRRRVVAIAAVVVILGIVTAGATTLIRSSSPPSAAPAELVSPSATPMNEPSMTSPPSPSQTATPHKKDKKDGKDPEPSWTAVPGTDTQNGDWANYPWGSDGLECPPPMDSPAAEDQPGAPGVVTVLGDSLIRDSRDAIASALADYGMRAQFICWGGKNLEWGLAQVQTLREMNLLPACLVINLGTNDLKGTTANGLADAVPLATVSKRLQQLLIESADISNVFAVDIAADLSLAPSTMNDVGQAPRLWQEAVETTGVGEVISWSAMTSADPTLIGSDGIHDSGSGQQERARMIADAVAPYCS